MTDDDLPDAAARRPEIKALGSLLARLRGEIRSGAARSAETMRALGKRNVTPRLIALWESGDAAPTVWQLLTLLALYGASDALIAEALRLRYARDIEAARRKVAELDDERG